MATIISTKTSGVGGLQVTGDASGVLQLASNNGTTAVTVDASQNVMIGNSTALFSNTNRGVLNVNGTSQALISLSNGASQSSAGYLYWNGDLNITNNATTGNITFQTNASTERMRIDSSGNVGIGQAPNSTTRLEVLSYNGSNGCMMQRVWSNGQYATWFQNASGTNVGNITVNAGGTVYTTTSDYRLKENVQPMVDALSKISQLKPVTYDWIADKTSAQGFIAHELQKVFPDAVTGEKDDVNEDGSIRPQGIDTSALVATLTAAIQELTARVIALEGK